MKNVLILGISGFTGRHFQSYITRRKLYRTHTFYGVDINPVKMPHITGIRANVFMPRTLRAIIAQTRPEYIVNLIGSYRQSSFQKLLRVNAALAATIGEIIIEENIPVEKLLLVGSAAEYGRPRTLPVRETAVLRPINDYGKSKAMQTSYALRLFREHGIQVCVGRTFNIVGEHMPASLVPGAFVEQIRKIRKSGSVHTGNLDSRRDFIAIEDVIDAYWRILKRGRAGEVYNVCSGRSKGIREILSFLIHSSGKDIQVEIGRLKKNDVPDIYGSYATLRRHTGWQPRRNIFSALKKISL